MITYQAGRSLLHRADPNSKMVWVVLVAASTFFLSLYADFLVLLLLVIITLLVARVGARTFLKGSATFVLIGCTVIVTRGVFTASGPQVLSIGPLAVTWDGLQTGGVYGLRLIDVALSSLLVLWTSRLKAIVDGLVSIGLPYRFAYTIFVALRFVPLISDELRAVREAHRVRGSRKRFSLAAYVNRGQSYAFALAINSMRRAEILATAMDLRGFGIYPVRTTVEDTRMTPEGMALLLASCTVIAILLIFVR